MGESFSEMINHALENSTHFLWLCTPESAASRWVKLEYKTFFYQIHLPDEKNRKFFILRGTGFEIGLVDLIYRDRQFADEPEKIIGNLPGKRPVAPDPAPEPPQAVAKKAPTKPGKTAPATTAPKPPAAKAWQTPEKTPPAPAPAQPPGFAAMAWRFVVRLKDNPGYESALETFLEEHPDTSEAVEARRELDGIQAPRRAAERRQQEAETAWKIALRANTRAAFELFAEEFPDSEYAETARQRLKSMDIVETMRRQKFEDKRKAKAEMEAEEPARLKDEEKRLKEAAQPKNGFVKRDLPDTPEMVFVEGGTFQMGSEENDYEKPVHAVQVKSFWMGRYPVTFEEYDLFCDATRREKPKDEGWGRGKRPVIYVSKQDADDYCAWLSKKTGQSYRLPTEAEWEFAARGGTLSKGFKFAGSNDLREVGWFSENSGGKTHPAGEKKANELGLCDMSGNVWECAEDDWHGNYTGAPADGSAWLGKTRGSLRAGRGGSWDGVPLYCRAANRSRWPPVFRHHDLGFRLALSLQ